MGIAPLTIYKKKLINSEQKQYLDSLSCRWCNRLLLLSMEVIAARKPNKDKVTGKKAASAAAKTMRSTKASPAAKTAAGSALSQRPGRKRK